MSIELVSNQKRAFMAQKIKTRELDSRVHGNDIKGVTSLCGDDKGEGFHLATFVFLAVKLKKLHGQNGQNGQIGLFENGNSGKQRSWIPAFARMTTYNTRGQMGQTGQAGNGRFVPPQRRVILEFSNQICEFLNFVLGSLRVNIRS
jgi:hypothetical protein